MLLQPFKSWALSASIIQQVLYVLRHPCTHTLSSFEFLWFEKPSAQTEGQALRLRISTSPEIIFSS